MSKITDNLEYILKESKTRYLSSIAKELKINVNSLYNYFKKHNIPRLQLTKITSEISDKLFELLEEKDLNSKELASLVGLTHDEVARWARSNKVKLKSARNRTVTGQLEQKVLALIDKGVIFHSICKKLKIASNVLYLWEKENNKSIPRKGYEFEFRKRLKETHSHLELVDYNAGGSSLYKCKKGHTFYRNASNIWKTGYCPKCTKPKSKPQNEIADWFKSIGVEVQTDRKILDNGKYPLEIDIWVAEKRIGIEYHGLHWHTAEKVSSRYHQKKATLAKNQDIQLIQIWEQEWETKQEILKSMILNKLGMSKFNIGARKLELKELTNLEASEFFGKNHLSGYKGNLYKVGLVDDKGEVLSAISFRKHKEGIEIARFCNKLDYNVMGGFNRLMKYSLKWIKKNGFDKIITFSDFRFSQGKVYENYGFDYLYLSAPDWFWFKDEGKGKGTIKNRRMSWGKKDNDFRKLGWKKVYGAGNLKFELKIT